MLKIMDSFYFKIIRYLKYFKRHICILSILTIIRIAVTFPVPKAIEVFFEALAGNKAYHFLTMVPVISFLILFRIIFEYISNIEMQKIGYSLTCFIQNKLMEKILAQSFRDLTGVKTGDTVAKITGDSSLFQEYVMNVIINPIISGIMLTVYIVILFKINVALTLVTVISFPLLGIIIGVYHEKNVKAACVYRDRFGILYNRLIELFGALKLIKAMHYEQRHKFEIGKEFGNLKDSGIKMSRIGSTSAFFTALVMNANLLTVLIFGGYLSAMGKLTLAQFIPYYMFLQLSYSPIESITVAFGGYQKGLGMLKRVFDILLLEDKKEESGKGHFEYGDITVKNLGFSYSNGLKIFDNFNCSFKKNAINVIVGSSGKGKTTLLDILLKLYNPEKGSITLGGTPINVIQPSDYAAHIAVFTQAPVIFDDTISQNISYFKQESSMAEIEEAAKQAHLDAHIQTLEHKYDTQVGERGNNLSGGECARIGLARIFLKKPSIIFMDEPTANIDGATEKIIYDALKQLKEHSMIIMIAHNKSALSIADNIIDLG